ncbi:hypothetical protein LCGC14_2921930 [marine sediment metagenome]|uniref:Uncharacterized protein n=1 Tax=marine sediment metagenome TaxID=412755 RepID=A0A0F8XNM7_9ZZZZ
MNGEEEKQNPLKQFAGAMGGNFTKERRNELYFGAVPKGAYPPGTRDLEHIHDLRMSPARKKALYGLGGGNVQDTGDFMESRLGTDSKSGLIREIAENSNLTRSEAAMIVDRWMSANGLEEVNDPQLGRIIVPRR